MVSSTRWVLLLLLAATAGAFMSPLRQYRPRRRDAVSLKSLESAGGEHISIEYCTGCRWMLRAAWMSQELLTTFQQELDSVTLIPSRPPAPGGVFTVKRNDKVVWDRKQDGGFPESKELKQRVRNLVAPNMFLGHSDTSSTEERREEREDCVDCERETISNADTTVLEKSGTTSANAPKPNVEITYCTGCRWLLRAAWVAQELLTTFDTELASVTLIPSRPPAKGGIFTVTLDDKVIWDRAKTGRFPQPKELKQMIRDRLAPSKDLGHSDIKNDTDVSIVDMIDDDEASDMRQYFGVM